MGLIEEKQAREEARKQATVEAENAEYYEMIGNIKNTNETTKKLEKEMQGIINAQSRLNESLQIVNADHHFLIKFVVGTIILCAALFGYLVYNIVQYRQHLERIEYMQMYPQSGLTLTTSDDEFREMVQNQIDYENAKRLENVKP